MDATTTQGVLLPLRQKSVVVSANDEVKVPEKEMNVLPA
jgi:hypothetical protein